MTRSARADAAGAVVVAIVIALLLPTGLVASAQDAVTPPADTVSDRVAVISFDERPAEVVAIESGLTPVPGRRGIYLRDLAVHADRAGAAAIVFVGFDSLTLYEGASDRQAIAESEHIQRLGIAPLLDMALEPRPKGIPRALRYRVDGLAAQFAGIGVPLVTDDRVVRTVPEVVLVPTIEPGDVVRSDKTPANHLVYGLAARAVIGDSGAKVGAATGDAIDMAGQSVPLEKGRLRIHWTPDLDDRKDPAVIAAEKLFGGGSAQDLNGKIVLIGSTDPANTTFYDTPQGPMPEVLISANAVNTMLTEAYLKNASPLIAWLVALGFAGLVAGLWRARWWLSLGAGLVLAAGWSVLTRVLAGDGWLVDPLRPAVAALVAVGVLGTLALVRQLLQRRRLAKLFSEYVPPGIARELINSGRAETAQAGERLLVTVLFCDLRGFTPLAARLAPAEVRTLLDTYYQALSPIVFDHGGTVLQYTGDEIFAVFGAPLPRTDHAEAALSCATAMHAALPTLNHGLHELDLPDIAYGIGLNSGLVVAANVGSTIRRQYSIIGDTVNVGSRLCGQAGAGDIIYPQNTRDDLADPPADDALGPVTLKGVDEPLVIYRLSGELAST